MHAPSLEIIYELFCFQEEKRRKAEEFRRLEEEADRRRRQEDDIERRKMQEDIERRINDPVRRRERLKVGSLKKRMFKDSFNFNCPIN